MPLQRLMDIYIIQGDFFIIKHSLFKEVEIFLKNIILHSFKLFTNQNFLLKKLYFLSL